MRHDPSLPAAPCRPTAPNLTASHPPALMSSAPPIPPAIYSHHSAWLALGTQHNGPTLTPDPFPGSCSPLLPPAHSPSLFQRSPLLLSALPLPPFFDPRPPAFPHTRRLVDLFPGQAGQPPCLLFPRPPACACLAQTAALLLRLCILAPMQRSTPLVWHPPTHRCWLRLRVVAAQPPLCHYLPPTPPVLPACQGFDPFSLSCVH